MKRLLHSKENQQWKLKMSEMLVVIHENLQLKLMIEVKKKYKMSYTNMLVSAPN